MILALMLTTFVVEALESPTISTNEAGEIHITTGSTSGVSGKVYINDVDVLDAIGILQTNQEVDKQAFTASVNEILTVINAQKREISALKSSITDCNTATSKAEDKITAVADAAASLEVCQQSLISTVVHGVDGDVGEACGGSSGEANPREVVTCTGYPELEHGHAKGAGVLPGAIRLLSCDDGYQLSAESALVVCHTDGKWSGESGTECTRTTTSTTTSITTLTTSTAAPKQLAMQVEGHSTTLSSGYAAKKAMDGNCNTYWQSCKGAQCVTSQWGGKSTVTSFEIYPIPHNQAPLRCDLQYSATGEDGSWKMAIESFSLKGYGSQAGKQQECQDYHWQRFTLDNEIRAQHWRLFMHNNQGHAAYMTVLEVRFFGRK